MLTDKNKTYETVLLLGKTTDTQDISGTVLSEKSLDGIDEDIAKQCIRGFVGDYMQVPPMYSALKVNGRKLYELAREGVEIERKARPVVIYDINIKEISLPRIRMEVTCSKGTYIRTLCYDIGEKLGCGGCMEELIRTKVSRFELKDSLTLKEVQQKKDAGLLDEILVPIDEMFFEYDSVMLKEEFEPFVYNGNMFAPKHMRERIELCDGKRVRVYDREGRFIAIYEFRKDRNMFKIVKMFFDKNE